MEKFFKYALAVLMSCVALLEFYQVVMRYIFELPVDGAGRTFGLPHSLALFHGQCECLPGRHTD